MSLQDKINSAKPTTFLTDGLSPEEVRECVKKGKERVRLLIDIPEDAYRMCQDLKTNNDDGIVGLCAVNSIANGTPLDDVKKEIFNLIDNTDSIYGTSALHSVLDILDNVSKAEREDK